MRGSKFEKFQEVKIQEEPDQVPQGHVPRAMTVHLYGDMTRQCAAGDTLTISGVFLPAGLITNTFLEAMSVEKHKKSSVDFTPTAEMQARAAPRNLRRSSTYCDVYSILLKNILLSIAPEIFGHDDVKKALLLLMVGGATRKMSDGMRIRGDVNICLMGDPGVAKSQLLKYIANTAPRAVYTTGKGSSGVGLTAAVVRDTVTGDLVLEGGALVLADMGICCIDEFDKMEEGDRTAIHEVMEQQTVSIAKAGITTTLNARTSVLAAANPAFSRYNTNRSVEENINLPAALLSRFDLLWLILDRPSHANDKRLAEHVTYVHRFSTHPALEFDPVSPQLMRAYIADITKIEPSVPPELAAYVVDEYVAMRQDAAENVENGYGFTSARTLLAILRLSQALARLRRSGTVSRDDVVEARRLMSLSKSSVLQVGDDDRDKAKQRGDAVSQVYRIIREHCDKSKAPAVAIAEILPKVLSRGLTQEALDECLREYAELDVWQLAGNGTIIRFVDAGDDDDA
uniref:DNA helicase n=1 Tax=Emiliania huxleyi (strain CCMP1516) TaxID=280463 RepID=A0A0D3J9T2_EMIH1